MATKRHKTNGLACDVEAHISTQKHGRQKITLYFWDGSPTPCLEVTMPLAQWYTLPIDGPHTCTMLVRRTLHGQETDTQPPVDGD